MFAMNKVEGGEVGSSYCLPPYEGVKSETFHYRCNIIIHFNIGRIPYFFSITNIFCKFFYYTPVIIGFKLIAVPPDIKQSRCSVIRLLHKTFCQFQQLRITVMTSCGHSQPICRNCKGSQPDFRALLCRNNASRL